MRRLSDFSDLIGEVACMQWRIQEGTQQARAPLNFDQLYIFLIQFCIKMLKNKAQIVCDST